MDEAPRKILSLSEWESMYERMVERAGVTAKTLNSFDQISHKAQVYGEAMPLLVDALIDIAQIKPTDVFFDIGSGIGNIVLQIAAQTGCKSYGIEIREDLHHLAEGLLEQFNNEYASRGVTAPEVKLIGGDALADSFEIDQYYVDSTVVFMNNWCFPPSLERGLCLKFEAMLQKDVKVIALKNLFPREEPWKQRYRDAPVQIFKMPWERYKFPEGCISWAHRPITAYIYSVDREFDFDKKVAFFDAQWKKNKNYKGRVTHTIHFDDKGKMEVKEVDETEEKQKKSKENKLPKVNDFVDLVRDSTGTAIVKQPKPRPQPTANGAPPKRKFRRRGKTPFLTDREGDDYICLTCKAKDRMPWRFKMSQQIAAHVRLHQFNPYKFDEDDEDGEEEDEASVLTNTNVPLIDLSNEKSIPKNGAEAEFAALISLMSIAQSSAMQIDTAPMSMPMEPVVEQAPIVNNENTHPEVTQDKGIDSTPMSTSSNKKPGDLNMRSRLTDSLNIDPAEIQRTRDRLAEKEKEAAKVNGEVLKPSKKLKNSAGNSIPNGIEEKKKSGEKPMVNGLKTSKDKPKKPAVTVPVTETPNPSQSAISPDPAGAYVIIDGQSFLYVNGELRPVSLRRATAHEPKSKRIIDNFPELPSERRSRKGLTKSKNDNTATNEASEKSVSEESKQPTSATEQTVDSKNEKSEQLVTQSEVPLTSPELRTATVSEEKVDSTNVAPVAEHVDTRPSVPARTVPKTPKGPSKSRKSSEPVDRWSTRPVSYISMSEYAARAQVVDTLPPVRSSLARPESDTRTNPDRMDIEQEGPVSETSPTIASVEQAAQAMDVIPTTEVADKEVPSDEALVSSAIEHLAEPVHDRAVDELPTAEVNASPTNAYSIARPEAAQETLGQPMSVDTHSAEVRHAVQESQPNVVHEAQAEAPMAIESKPEEASVPELIVTPAVIDTQPAHVPSSSEEKSASERESVKEESKSSSNKKRKRAPSTTDKPDAAIQDDNTDVNNTPQSAQPKPKKRRFASELTGLFHGQINYDYKIEKEFLYSTKRSCVVKKETVAAAPKTPSRPMTSSPQPRARSRKAGANDPALKTPPVSPIKFDLKDDEERSTSAKPTAKPKPLKRSNNNNNNNTNKNQHPMDPEPLNTNENKPKSSTTEKPIEKAIEKTTTHIPEEPTEVNTNTTAKAPARPRSKSKSKPKDLAESILAKVSNLTPIKNANKHLPKPKIPSKSKKPSASRSESPSTSTPSSPSKPAPLVRNTSTAAALLLLAEAEKELLESSTVVSALHSTNALIPEALSDNEQIALSAVMTDMEIIDTAPRPTDHHEAVASKPAERQVVDISDQVDAEPERMIDIATDADAQEAPVTSENASTAVHIDLTPAPEQQHDALVNDVDQPSSVQPITEVVQESQSNKSVNDQSAAEAEPMSDQSVDQTMNDSANDKLLHEAIEAHVVSRHVVPDAASARPSNTSADPAPVTNMSMLQSIEYLKTKGSALVEPVGTVDVLPDNEGQSSYFATIANYQDVDDDEDDDILLLPTDS